MLNPSYLHCTTFCDVSNVRLSYSLGEPPRYTRLLTKRLNELPLSFDNVTSRKRGNCGKYMDYQPL